MAPTQSNDQKPVAGDLIQIFRTFYEHWGVCAGHDSIVHLTSPTEGLGATCIGSTFSPKAIVEKEELSKVVENNKWKINNWLDEKHQPRSADVIEREACAKVGDVWPYNVFTGNCEHFATNLRYGTAKSGQVDKAGENVLVAGGVAVGVAGLLGVAYLLSGSRKENKNTK